jgi:hypothetical protein
VPKRAGAASIQRTKSASVSRACATFGTTLPSAFQAMSNHA